MKEIDIRASHPAQLPPPSECARIRVYHLVLFCDPPNEAPFHIREHIATEGRAEQAARAALALENERRASVQRPPIVDFEIEEALLHQIYRSTISWRAVAPPPATTQAAAGQEAA